MAEPLPIRLHIDPPMDQWRVAPRNGRTKPVIATGHQPYLWHPGILAKYIAADVYAQHVQGSTLDVIVDHNPLEPLSFDLPKKQGDVLSASHLLLDERPDAGSLPPNRLSPLHEGQASHLLRKAVDPTQYAPSIHKGVIHIAQVYTHISEQLTQAGQTTLLLNQLRYRFLEEFPETLSTSQLVTATFLDRLLADPIRSVRSYNHAAHAYPAAGIRPLYVGRDVVEVPLWAQGDSTVTPVYADLGDSGRSQLFTVAHNQHLDLTGDDALQHLRPRAITLSAIMRSELCDLFIHGTGGGVYDQVTERWWKDWTGETLAPMAVVSADIYLPFDVPVATPEEHTQAQWFAHHLPHNVDRYAEAMDGEAAELSREKRGLLDRMSDDRDKRRRAKAFARIHAINAELARLHHVLIQSAKQRADDARVGVANANIARRRDWCFA